MKLIIIVKSKNRPKTFTNTTLKYISRAGYDYRIYVKRSQKEKYLEAISDAMVKYRLYVSGENIKTGAVRIPKKYNLALYLPDNIKGFTDDRLLWFCREVGGMRKRFNRNERLVKFSNKTLEGAYMVKLQ